MAIKPDEITTTVLADVFTERERQYVKLTEKNLWDCADPNVQLGLKMMVLGEEYGEVCREMLEAGFQDKPAVNLYQELVQVAAVAVACAEALRRAA